MKKGHIAFWKYDLFPFILWGTIEKTHGEYVETKQHGRGYSFKPLFVLRPEEGEKLIAKLIDLKCRRQNMIDEIEALYRMELLAMVPKLKPKK